MTKPKLPKRWIDLSWCETHHEGSLVLYTKKDAVGRSALLYRATNGILEIHQFVSIATEDKVSLQRLVRAVELAAIHAGLVEDREP